MELIVSILICFAWIIGLIIVLILLIKAFIRNNKQSTTSTSASTPASTSNSIKSILNISVPIIRYVDGYSYVPKIYLMSENELKFYKVLFQAVGGKYQIMSKVGLMDIVETNEINWIRHTSAFNKIRGKHIDFILIEPSTSKIMYAIELDDSSHRGRKARINDKFKNELFCFIRIPLIRFPSSNVSVEFVVNKLANACKNYYDSR
jgi:hypothetical protein